MGQETSLARVRPSKREIQGVTPQLSLTLARSVLEAVVRVHEDTFTQDSNWVDICGFPKNEIREAAKIVAGDIFKGLPEDIVLPGSYRITKQAPVFPPDLVCDVNLSQTIAPGNETRTEARLSLDVSKTGLPFLINTFPLADPEAGFARVAIGFCDFRQDPYQIGKLTPYQRAATLQDFKLMLRGTRWMFANMLEWKKEGLIHPESLDRKILSEPSPSQGLST